MSTGKQGPRRAFPARSEAATEPEHPLAPTSKGERSRLAEAAREPFGTRLPGGLIQEVKIAAVTRGIKVQEAVEQALRAWLDQ